MKDYQLQEKPSASVAADPDPVSPDLDPSFHFNVDLDPDPTFHFDADLDPAPSFQIKA